MMKDAASAEEPEPYTPDHPWYYKLGGQPKAFDDIPPSPRITGISVAFRLPAAGNKRRLALSKALAEVDASLQTSRREYEELQERGLDAISEHDKRLAAIHGEVSMALYDALARSYCYITFLKSQQRNLAALMPAEQRNQGTLF